MTPCDGTPNSTIWCCGGTTNCCGENAKYESVQLPQTLTEQVRTSNIPSTASATSSLSTKFPRPTTSPIPIHTESGIEITPGTAAKTARSSSTPPSSAGTSGPDDTSERLSTGAKAGISIGVAFGTITLFGLGYFLVKSLQWKREAVALKMNMTEISPSFDVRQFRQVYGGWRPSELDSYRDPYELSVSKSEESQRQELA